MNFKPNWLKIAENGSKGEARTKALLLDRFWVLERSVDIEGADFIVQSRTGRHTLDKNPPRLGLVQAKYFQDLSTTTYIHSEYVCNEKGEARPEFFVVIHSEDGDDQKTYFLTANQVIEHFKKVEEGKEYAGRYKINGRDVLTNSKFLLTRKEMLDTIQKALDVANAKSNQLFIGNFLPDSARRWLNESEILKLTKANVADHFCDEIDIITTVNSWKKTAKENYSKIKWMTFILEEILETNDPIAALCCVDHFVFEQYDISKFTNHQTPAKGSDLDDLYEEYYRIYFEKYLEKNIFKPIWEETNNKINETINTWKTTNNQIQDNIEITISLKSNIHLNEIKITPTKEKPAKPTFKNGTYTSTYKSSTVYKNNFIDDIFYDLESIVARETATFGKNYLLL